MDFSEEYDRLEKKFEEKCRKEGSVYIPNIKPEGKVDCAFIGWEPSTGAGEGEELREKINKGLKNFMWSFEDFLFHFCTKEFCSDRYYITDLSKGVMKVGEAEKERLRRYDDWFGLLLEEISLVCKTDTSVFLIGKSVDSHIERNLRNVQNERLLRFLNSRGPILHYSQQAARWRSERFEKDNLSCTEFTKEDVMKNAERLLNREIKSERLKSSIIERLRNRKFSNSLKKLISIYQSKMSEEC